MAERQYIDDLSRFETSIEADYREHIKEKAEKEPVNLGALMRKKVEEQAKRASAFDTQVGGSHYSKHKIQPLEFITANDLDFVTGNIIKYVVREKGDKAKQIEDLEKARHYINMKIELLQRHDS